MHASIGQTEFIITLYRYIWEAEKITVFSDNLNIIITKYAPNNPLKTLERNKS